MATSSSGFWAPQHLCPSRAPITLDETITPDLEISSSSSDFKPSTWGRMLLRWVTVKDWEMAAEQKLSRTCCPSRFYLKHADFNCYFLNFRTTTVIMLALELGRTLRARIRCPHVRVSGQIWEFLEHNSSACIYIFTCSLQDSCPISSFFLSSDWKSNLDNYFTCW